MIDRSKKQEEKPDMAGRLGIALHWLGCSLGILAVPLAVWAATEVVERNRLFMVAAILAAGVGCWFFGRTARLILKGD